MIGCDEKLFEALKVVRREYDAAVAKHPAFPVSLIGAVSVISEELGELARECNDITFGEIPKIGNKVSGILDARQRALTEAAHVAVTAIRTIQMLMGE